MPNPRISKICGKATGDGWLWCTLKKGHEECMHYDAGENQWFIEGMIPWHYPAHDAYCMSGECPQLDPIHRCKVPDHLKGHSARECKQRGCK